MFDKALAKRKFCSRNNPKVSARVNNLKMFVAAYLYTNTFFVRLL